jgi:RHS repeat-associated protein
MKTQFLKYLLLVLLICFKLNGFALSRSNSVSYGHTNLLQAVTNGTANSVFAENSFTDGLSRTDTDSKIKIRLNVGDDYLFGKNPFEVSLTLRIEAFDVDGTTENALNHFARNTPIELTLLHTSPEAYYELDVDDWFSTYPSRQQLANAFKIYVVDYSADALVQRSLQLSIVHEVEYTINVTNVETEITQITSAANPQTFSWIATTNAVAVSDIPYWQFQLLRLYNIDEDNIVQNEITAEVNWGDALNLFLEGSQTNLSLTIGEGSGYYIWRVRPIGNDYENPIADSRNYGSWSHVNDNYTLSLDGSGDPENTFWFRDPDNNINWIYGRTFSEGDASASIKAYETKAYSNGLYMMRQAQAINQSEGFVVATQQLADMSGNEGALISMPVPLTNKRTFEYISNFMVTSPGALYTASDFSDDDSYLSPSAVDSSRYFRYYSDYNTDKNIPSAQGYPFAIARLKAGRLAEQSGFGKALRMGNNHTVKTYYCQASETELVRLFGDEAPKSNKVYKVITLDQNNVMSVTMINHVGQVIVTCQAGNKGNASVDALQESSAINFTVREKMTGGGEDYIPCGDNCYELSKTLDVDLPIANVTFNYTIDPAQYSSVPMYCQTCDYNITISIMGENTSYTFSHFLASAACSAGSQKWDTVFTLPLEYGVWTVSRKIEMNNAQEEDQDLPEYAQTPMINMFSNELADLLSESGEEEISGLMQNIRTRGIAALSEASSAFSRGNTLFSNLSNTSTHATVRSILAESFSSQTAQMLSNINTNATLSSLFQNHSSEEDNATFESELENFQLNLLQSLADRIEATQERLEESYTEHCLDYSEIQDTLSYRYSKGSYHYTLFYYDRAGNLVRTVQPAGVDLSSTTRTDHPNHAYETEYDYNFLGQTVRKKTTDGGETVYYYDDNKRIRFSQNAKQNANNTYSYIKYDDLGRIIEAGESDEDEANLESNVNSSIFPGTGNDRIYTVYSVECAMLPATASQAYLRNRISYVYNDNDAYIAYSYDPHGNVKSLYSFVPGLCLSKNDVKITEYEYDLISNQVKKISYNSGNVDQFFYAYTYDANRRVTAVKTSTDDKIYDSDARYRYFKHGPLKRMEIGEDNIQGVDYTYTLQGLLKAINHASLDKNLDPARDNLSNNFAADAFATMLAYYTDDYYKSGSQYNTNSSNVNCIVPTATSSLYNGMITSEVSKTINSPLTQNLSCKNAWGYSYRYDELYRLKRANTFVSNGSNFSATENYKMQVAYDANGNITSMQRNAYVNTTNGAQLDMDQLTYNYTASTNKLTDVTDAVAAANYTVDIDDQIANNYQYDDVGNLTSDVASGIDNISWNVQNKPESVTKLNGTTLAFTYDPMGNRISKTLITKNSQLTTYYVRDAKGSLLAIYKEENNTSSGTTEKVLTLDETPLSAGSQIGSYKPEVWVRRIENAGSSSEVLTKNSLSTASSYSRELGKKQYQLNDHLGNVRVTFTDIKLSEINATTQAPQNFRAEINSISNYYAYGMLMVGNSYNTSNTTFGYQGKEKDSELEGEGCAYDFGARLLDPRVGRWLSMDPLAEKFPSESPYSAMGNDAVNKIDPNGKEPLWTKEVLQSQYPGATYVAIITGMEVAKGVGGGLLVNVTTGTINGSYQVDTDEGNYNVTTSGSFTSRSYGLQLGGGGGISVSNVQGYILSNAPITEEVIQSTFGGQGSFDGVCVSEGIGGCLTQSESSTLDRGIFVRSYALAAEAGVALDKGWGFPVSVVEGTANITSVSIVSSDIEVILSPSTSRPIPKPFEVKLRRIPPKPTPKPKPYVWDWSGLSPHKSFKEDRFPLKLEQGLDHPGPRQGNETMDGLRNDVKSRRSSNLDDYE